MIVMRNEEIEALANNLIKKLNINKLPIPVEVIPKHLNIELQYESFDGQIDGLLYRDEDSEQYVIGVNSKHLPNRRRFTIAHEIGHFLLHHGESIYVDGGSFQVNFRDSESSKGANIEEIEANLFAAALLMPEELVKETVMKRLKNGIDFLHESEELDKIANDFKVSVQALCIRLGRLGYTF